MTERIAFLGIGLMGAPMAANLLKAGFTLTAWNRGRAKADALASDGAGVAATAADAVRGADIVITMLRDGPAVEAVLFGAENAAAALRQGALVIDMSSIPPATARDHAARLGQREVAHLDAPVSGGTGGARDGALVIMAGGGAADFARARPVFAPLGKPTLVGGSGSGQLAKLCNQAIVGITIGAVAEALLLAAAGGADPAAVREALMGGFADSRILREHGQRMLNRRFLPGARVSMQIKDLDTVLDAARQAKLDLPLSRRVTELFKHLAADGGAGYDHSGLLLDLEKRNVPARVGSGPDTLPE
ncbi:MAG TPA: NAD(P)-dependent oxidoreductase [Stellaceae bacterium]